MDTLLKTSGPSTGTRLGRNIPDRVVRRNDVSALQSVICRITLGHDPKLQEQEAEALLRSG